MQQLHLSKRSAAAASASLSQDFEQNLMLEATQQLFILMFLQQLILFVCFAKLQRLNLLHVLQQMHQPLAPPPLAPVVTASLTLLHLRSLHLLNRPPHQVQG